MTRKAPENERSVTAESTSSGDPNLQSIREEIRARLELECESLATRVAEVRETRTQSTIAVTEAVGAQDDVGAELRVADALEAQFRDALDAVQLALSRLDHPSFGVCADCERPIPSERLLVIPETRHCVTCGMRASRDHRT
jgi:RNA polymerase-binding transcription factor DksA